MRFEREIHVYTDGACDPNPGRGGFGIVIRNPKTDQTIELMDGPFEDTTNNQMEMLAIIRALRFLHRRVGPQNIVIFTDSQYVINGITQWIHKWKKRGWKTAHGQLVKNAGLWMKIEEGRDLHKLTAFEWVRGHADNPYNSRADELAVAARKRACKPQTQIGIIA